MSKEKDKGLAIFDLNKPVNLKETVALIKQNIIDGDIDECKAGIILKKMAKISEEVLKDSEVKEAIREDTLRNLENGKPTRIFGATVSHAPTYTFFKFDDCNDIYWDELDSIERSVKALKKERETFLKTLIPTKSNLVPMGILKTGKTEIIEQLPKLIWEECGEIVELVPPIKGQKMGIKYSGL